MGISFTKSITCNGCNKELGDTENWSSFLENVSGTADRLFAEQIVVCNLECFKNFAANVALPTGQ